MAASLRSVIYTGLLALLSWPALWLVIIAGQPVDALAQAVSNEAAPTSMIVEHTGPRPNNAIITNRGWRCPDGYALGGSGRCEAVRAPSNAIVAGNRWRCMPGFVRRADRCERLLAPAYGFIQDNSMKCTAGYQLTGENKCVAVVPSRYAIVAGNEWRCIPGYSRSDDKCEIIKPPANG